jgi:MoxR-like ATPase
MTRTWKDVDDIVQLKKDGMPISLARIGDAIVENDDATLKLLISALRDIDPGYTAALYPYADIKVTTNTLAKRFEDLFDEGKLIDAILEKATNTDREDREIRKKREAKRVADDKEKVAVAAGVRKKEAEAYAEKKKKKELEDAGIVVTEVPSAGRVGVPKRAKKDPGPKIPVKDTIKFEVLSSNSAYEIYVPDEDLMYEFPSWSGEFTSLLDRGMNIWLYGGTGAGKSSLAEQVCAIGKIPLIYQSFHEDIKPDSLFGNFRLEDGNTVWQDGPVTKAYREGLVLLLDEIDGTPPEILFCLYAILDRKPLVLADNGCEVVKPHENFRIIATGNTLGRGDDQGSYCGTNVLNRAFLNRFRIWYEVEYPKESVYKKIIMNEGVAEGVAKLVARLAREINTAAMNGTLTETFSLRDARDIAKAADILGGNVQRALQLSLLNRLPIAEQAAINDVYKRLVSAK